MPLPLLFWWCVGQLPGSVDCALDNILELALQVLVVCHCLQVSLLEFASREVILEEEQRTRLRCGDLHLTRVLIG